MTTVDTTVGFLRQLARPLTSNGLWHDGWNIMRPFIIDTTFIAAVDIVRPLTPPPIQTLIQPLTQPLRRPMRLLSIQPSIPPLIRPLMTTSRPTTIQLVTVLLFLTPPRAPRDWRSHFGLFRLVSCRFCSFIWLSLRRQTRCAFRG